MDEQTQKQQQELITIAGGVEMEVNYQNNGDKEVVKVRQIPISQISKFIMVMSDEAKAIELYCGKPEGWADTLMVESASAIADKGQELNLPFFSAWFTRQMKWRASQQSGETTTDTQGRTSELKAPPSANLPLQSPTITT